MDRTVSISRAVVEKGGGGEGGFDTESGGGKDGSRIDIYSTGT